MNNIATIIKNKIKDIEYAHDWSIDIFSDISEIVNGDITASDVIYMKNVLKKDIKEAQNSDNNNTVLKKLEDIYELVENDFRILQDCRSNREQELLWEDLQCGDIELNYIKLLTY